MSSAATSANGVRTGATSAGYSGSAGSGVKPARATDGLDDYKYGGKGVSPSGAAAAASGPSSFTVSSIASSQTAVALPGDFAPVPALPRLMEPWKFFHEHDTVLALGKARKFTGALVDVNFDPKTVEICPFDEEDPEKVMPKELDRIRRNLLESRVYQFINKGFTIGTGLVGAYYGRDIEGFVSAGNAFLDTHASPTLVRCCAVAGVGLFTYISYRATGLAKRCLPGANVGVKQSTDDYNNKLLTSKERWARLGKITIVNYLVEEQNKTSLYRATFCALAKEKIFRGARNSGEEGKLIELTISYLHPAINLSEDDQSSLVDLTKTENKPETVNRVFKEVAVIWERLQPVRGNKPVLRDAVQKKLKLSHEETKTLIADYTAALRVIRCNAQDREIHRPSDAEKQMQAYFDLQQLSIEGMVRAEQQRVETANRVERLEWQVSQLATRQPVATVDLADTRLGFLEKERAVVAKIEAVMLQIHAYRDSVRPTSTKTTSLASVDRTSLIDHVRSMLEKDLARQEAIAGMKHEIKLLFEALQKQIEANGALRIEMDALKFKVRRMDENAKPKANASAAVAVAAASATE